MLVVLQQNKAPIEIFPKYTNYTDIYSPNLAIKLPENTGINKYTIELDDDKQKLYGPIYRLGPIELEFIKAYIKTYLKTGFFQQSKLLARAFILFNKKLNGSLHLYINY